MLDTLRTQLRPPRFDTAIAKQEHSILFAPGLPVHEINVNRGVRIAGLILRLTVDYWDKTNMPKILWPRAALFMIEGWLENGEHLLIRQAGAIRLVHFVVNPEQGRPGNYDQ